MGGYLITQAGGVASSGIGDAGLMASYLFTLRVLGIVRGLALAPVQSAVPRFIAYRSKGDWAGLRREFTRRIILCLGIAAALSFAIWLGVGYFVEHAGKELRLLSGPMFLIAAITGLLEVNHCGYSILYITKNRVPFLAASLVSGVSIAVLSLLVVGPWSVWGLLLVQATVQLAFNNWFPVYLVLNDFQRAVCLEARKGREV
jgi:O-antigen/teichoic acid export membrane protein